MQVLTLVVQNTASYSDLGTSTSAVRSRPQHVSSSVMGTLQQAGIGTAAGDQPQADRSGGLPPDRPPRAPGRVHHAYADALRRVVPVPVAILALILAVFLPQVPMREAAKGRRIGPVRRLRNARTGQQPCNGDHRRPGSCGVTGARILRNVLAHTGRGSMSRPRGDLLTVGIRSQFLNVTATQSSLGAAHLGLPEGVLTSFYDGIADAGYLTRDGDVLTLTDTGSAEVEILARAWRMTGTWTGPRLAARGSGDDNLTADVTASTVSAGARSRAATPRASALA